MTESGFREIQLSGKQVVFLFMAGVVAAVGIFLLGVSAGRGVTGGASATDPAQSPAAATTSGPLPPATTPKPNELQYFNTLQGKPTGTPSTPPPPAAATSTPTPTPSATPPAAPAKPSPTPAKPTTSPTSKPAPVAGGWYVQVDSFGSRDNASKQVAELKGRGYAASVYTATGTTAPYKVRIGPPMEQAAADAMIAKLRKEGVQAVARPLAVLSGLLLVGSFPKFGHPALAWVSLSPLIVAVALSATAGARPLRAFGLGVLTGIVYFVGTLYWTGIAMAAHGGVAPPIAFAVMMGLALHLSLFVGLFAWILARTVRRYGVSGVWLAPAIWVATEWLRAWLGWDFPWVLLGTSQTGALAIVQLASVTGVYGLSFLVALVGTAAAALALSRARAHVVGAAVTATILALVIVGGAWRVGRGTLTHSGTPMRIGVLQGNFPEKAADAAGKVAIMERYIALSRQAVGEGAQLVMWPEASVPFFFDLDAVAAEPVRRLAAEARVPFILGSDELERFPDGRAKQYFNAAVLVGSDGRTTSSYRKIQLVPFGEYVPFKKILFFVGPLVEAVADFSAGDEFKVFDIEGSPISVAICYEAVYSRIAQAFVERGSRLLATITNDAWFGHTSAPYQHFDQAALRAVEQGRYLVRAANTGISGAVDPYGRVVAKTALLEATALTVDVRLLSGRTIYHAIGDVVAWISLAIALALLALSRRPRT